jgi:selenocysteine lyase/cysteine desulfurase
VDAAALGADFFVCSPYKFFGPHCAALVADPALLETLRPDKLLPSTDAVPERFELGTLPYEMMAGVTAAVDFIAGLAPASGSRRERVIAANRVVEEHELALRERIEDGLAGFGDRVTLHSRASERTPTLLFTLASRDTAEASRFLAGLGILAPAGSFYAYEPFRALNLPVDSGMRVGLAPYNDATDVDRLLEGLADFF